jgi:hypothetical protein
MKFLTLLPIFCLTIASGFSQSRMNIIPKPVQVIEKNGEFRYGTDSRIYTAPGFKEIGLYLAEVMNIPASQVSVLKTGDKPQAGIILQKISAPAADSAAYQITIAYRWCSLCRPKPGTAEYDKSCCYTSLRRDPRQTPLRIPRHDARRFQEFLSAGIHQKIAERP